MKLSKAEAWIFGPTMRAWGKDIDYYFKDGHVTSISEVKYSFDNDNVIVFSIATADGSVQVHLSDFSFSLEPNDLLMLKELCNEIAYENAEFMDECKKLREEKQ